MQDFQCNDCKKYWSIKKSFLQQYYKKESKKISIIHVVPILNPVIRPEMLAQCGREELRE